MRVSSERKGIRTLNTHDCHRGEIMWEADSESLRGDVELAEVRPCNRFFADGKI